MIEFEEYNRLFKGFQSIAYVGSCKVEETEAKDNGFEVREVSFCNMTNGVKVPHEVLKTITSAYSKTKAMSFLYHDCDGIFCFRDGDVLIFNLCELKTTASADKVCEAKDQILCSLVKLRILLSHLQSYDDNIKVRAFVAAHEPTVAQKTMLKRPNNPQDRFLSNLLYKHPHTVSQYYLEKELYPIKMKPVEFYFIGVPRGSQRVRVDYSRL